MSVIIIPRKHLRQPQGRLSLAEPWSLCLVNGRGINGEPGTPITAGVPQIVPSPSGGLALRTSSSAAMKLPGRAGTYSSCMGVAVFRRTGTLAAYARLAGSRADGQGLAAYVNYGGESQNQVRFTHDTKVVRIDAIGVVKDSQQVTVVGFYLDKNDGHEIYEGGKSILTSRNGGGDLFVSTSHVIFGSESSSSIVSPFDGEVSLFALAYGRGSREEARQLSLAPWEMFRADPIRIYSFPSGPISLTINSITAYNITSSGARVTLGLTR